METTLECNRNSYLSNEIPESVNNTTTLSSQIKTLNLYRESFLNKCQRTEFIGPVNYRKREKSSGLDYNDISNYRRERFDFAQPIRVSVTDDTSYDGSNFISDWLIKFTKGTLKVNPSSLFEALVFGILHEGEKLNDTNEAQKLVQELYSIKSKKLNKLQRCCARLYTKQCFLFQLVNQTLRDDDRSKLTTLGPFCYLLYNYIDKRPSEYLTLKYQLKSIIKSTQQLQPITVYRGEELPLDQIKIYTQAMEKDVSFKWSSFISTSKNQNVAELFSSNVFHIIQIQRDSCSDQFVDISSISYMEHEEEILLRPGVRFQITNYDYDPTTKRFYFNVLIKPSFISNII